MTDLETSPLEAETDVEEVETDQAEDAIRTAFDEALNEEGECEADDVKMAMIGAGATFKNVTRLYNAYCIDAGLAISPADRKQAVEDFLTGKEFETEEDFNECVDGLVIAVKGATERSAGALIRAYAKRNELTAYAKPKGEVGSRPGFVNDFYNWLVANPTSTKEEASAYVMGAGDHKDTSDNVKRHISHYLGVWSLVNRVANPADVVTEEAA